MNALAAQTLLRDLQAIRTGLDGDDFETLQRRVTAYVQALRAGIEATALSREDCRQLRQIQRELQAIILRRRDEAITWLSQNRRMRNAIVAYSRSRSRGLWGTL